MADWGEPDLEKELSLIQLAGRDQKARLRSLLGCKKGREKFLASLYHNPPFDPRYVTVLEMNYDEAVKRELVARGAPDQCYVISNSFEHDGTTMSLDQALQELNDHGWTGDGTILLCVPGRLAYYIGEAHYGGGYTWIVERPSRS